MNRIYKNNEFMREAAPILEHSEFSKTKEIVHHGSTRYNHSIRVAYCSYLMSKVLKADVKASVKAGVLHDFFLERDDKNIAASTKMLVNHPTIAKENAIRYFNINEKEQNIIESHMFPFSAVSPKSKEAWIVTTCDKLVSSFEGADRFKTQLSIWVIFFINFVK
ncbi:MAG: HD domain-containing protein [Bacilli bacterium]